MSISAHHGMCGDPLQEGGREGAQGGAVSERLELVTRDSTLDLVEKTDTDVLEWLFCSG